MPKPKSQSSDRAARGHYYLGIDPGASGGMAVVDPSGHLDWAGKMAPTEQDNWYQIRQWKTITIAVIEKVHSMPAQGVASTFKFGQNYGMLRGFLIAAGIPFMEVSPQRWQKDIGIHPIKGEGKTDHKNRTKARAQQLFPKMSFTHATADAALIALWASRFAIIGKRG